MIMDNDTVDLDRNDTNAPFAFEIPNRELVKSLDDDESWSLETWIGGSRSFEVFFSALDFEMEGYYVQERTAFSVCRIMLSRA